MPKSREITIRPIYGAGGYVAYENYSDDSLTERECKTRLAIIMAGRAAEKCYYDSHTPGCRGDYENAQKMAAKMIESFAM